MELELDAGLQAYLLALAEQNSLDAPQLFTALAAGDTPALALLLGHHESVVVADLVELRRAVVIDGDWGAGCALLTETVRAQAEAALAALISGRSSPAPATEASR